MNNDLDSQHNLLENNIKNSQTKYDRDIQDNKNAQDNKTLTSSLRGNALGVRDDIISKLDAMNDFDDSQPVDYSDINCCHKEAFKMLIAQDTRLNNLFIKDSNTRFLMEKIGKNITEIKDENKLQIWRIISKVASIMHQYCGTYKVHPNVVFDGIISFDGQTINFWGKGLAKLFTQVASIEARIKIINFKYKYIVQDIKSIIDSQDTFNAITKDNNSKDYFEVFKSKIMGVKSEAISILDDEIIKIPKDLNRCSPITGVVGTIQYSIGDPGNIEKVEGDYHFDLSYSKIGSFWIRNANKTYKDFPSMDHIVPVALKYPTQLLRTRIYNKLIGMICERHGLALKVVEDYSVDDADDKYSVMKDSDVERANIDIKTANIDDLSNHFKDMEMQKMKPNETK